MSWVSRAFIKQRRGRGWGFINLSSGCAILKVWQIPKLEGILGYSQLPASPLVRHDGVSVPLMPCCQQTSHPHPSPAAAALSPHPTHQCNIHTDMLSLPNVIKVNAGTSPHNWHHHIQYTKLHHMNLISFCLYEFGESWLICACY